MPRIYVDVSYQDTSILVAVAGVSESDPCTKLAKTLVQTQGFRRRFAPCDPDGIRFRVCGKPEGGLLPVTATVNMALGATLTPMLPGYADAVAVFTKSFSRDRAVSPDQSDPSSIDDTQSGSSNREAKLTNESIGSLPTTLTNWQAAALQTELGLRGGSYREAIEVLRSAIAGSSLSGLKAAPAEARIALLRCRAWVQMAVGRPARAAKLYRQAVALAGGGGAKADPELECELAESLLQSGEHKAAVQVYDGAAVKFRTSEAAAAAAASSGSAPPSGGTRALAGARAAHGRAQGKGGRMTLCKGPGGLCTSPFPGTYSSTDALLGCARALWQGGSLAGGVQVINAIVETGAGDEHAGVLVEYSRACEALEQHGDSLQQILRAILLKQDDRSVKKRLAQVLARPGMAAAAVAILGGDSPDARDRPGAEGKTQAIGYLAGAVKDFGACEASIALRQSGLRLGPRSANVALNLAHDLECVGDLQGALSCIAAFCRHNATAEIVSTGPISFEAAEAERQGTLDQGTSAAACRVTRSLQLGEVLPALEAASRDLHAWARAAGVPVPLRRPLQGRESAAGRGDEAEGEEDEQVPSLDDLDLAQWVTGTPAEERTSGSDSGSGSQSVAGGGGRASAARTTRGGVTPLQVVQGYESAEGLDLLPRTALFAPAAAVDVKPAGQDTVADGLRDGVRAAWRNRLSTVSDDASAEAARSRAGQLQEAAYLIDAKGARQVVVWMAGPWPYARVVPEREAVAARKLADTASKVARKTPDFIRRRSGESAEELSKRVAKSSRAIHDAAQLDTLALLMTAVKVLHIAGALPLLPPLIAAIERVRMGCALHQTSIRNEAAYYACVAQVTAVAQDRQLRSEAVAAGHHLDGTPSDEMSSTVSAAGGDGDGGDGDLAEGDEDVETADALPMLPSCGPEPPVFLLGDSHCVSPAWTTVRVPPAISSGSGSGVAVGAEVGMPVERLLRPALVTGCKVWHLRRESTFYPRVNYEAVAGALPEGSDIVWMPGEIDCREGIIRAVSQMRYKDGDQAVKSVVRIAVEKIESLARKLQARIFVHPVPPVVDVTRPIVAAYNIALQQEVKVLQAKFMSEAKTSNADAALPMDTVGGRSQPRPMVYWLDFFDSLLQETRRGDGGGEAQLQLDPRWELDGTHLHPDYVSLIGDSMTRCLQ